MTIKVIGSALDRKYCLFLGIGNTGMRAYSQLADLEVLLNSIPDENIRAYAAEAISSYSAGAYRAAIVSTWIAVIFDLYQKIRYLDEQYGDLAAKKCAEEIDENRSRSDKKQVAAWEREVLKNAYEKVKMINETEYEHLDRIQKDRHKCAHPVLDQDGFLFQPSPELARTHIRTAIEILLSQPTVIGKAAVDAFERDVEKKNYPDEEERIIRGLAGRHLPMSAKYRSNLIKFCFKKIIRLEPDEESIIRKYIYIFKHLAEEYRHDFESIEKQFFTKEIENMREERYSHFSGLLYLKGELWDAVSPHAQEIFRSYIDNEDAIYLKIFTLHLFENVREEILKKYAESCKKQGVYARNLISNLTSFDRKERISKRNPEFIKGIVDQTIKAFCSNLPNSKIATSLLNSASILMDSEDIKRLLESLNKLEPEDDQIFSHSLMENIFIRTIDAFPETIHDWKSFYEAKKEVWINMEKLGEMIDKYPNHGSVIEPSINHELLS